MCVYKHRSTAIHTKQSDRAEVYYYEAMRRALNALRRFIGRTPLSTTAILSIGFFIAGMFAAPVFVQTGAITASHTLREKQDTYPLIYPVLLCNLDPKPENEDSAFSAALKKFADDRNEQKQFENISVFVLDYSADRWAAVDPDERYDPASMLKVPLMMAYYHEAEQNTNLLLQQAAFKGDDQNSGEYFKASAEIQPSKAYTVEQLLESMIINSDNTAAALLEQMIDKEKLGDVYVDLGLSIPHEAPNVSFMSVKSYAYFLRLLYNSTYLSRAYSEKILELMSRSTFSKGIKAGVPAGTIVADKFGERTIYETGTGVVDDRELHDCGFVYKKDNPYLVCIMTRGKDFDMLAQTIADFSKFIYDRIGK